jgi:hypothetical protein
LCTEKAQQAKGVKGSNQPARVRKTVEGVIRSTWTSWDSELVQALPAEVQHQFPVVLNSGIAMHKPLFLDLCREVAAGRRSFAEWVRSHRQHQHQLYYDDLLRWLYYTLRCQRQLQHPMRRALSGAASQGAAPATATTAAAGKGPSQ